MSTFFGALSLVPAAASARIEKNVERDVFIADFTVIGEDYTITSALCPFGEQIRLLINKDAGSLKDIKVSKREKFDFP